MPQGVDIPMGWSYPKRKRFLAELTQSQQAKYTYPLTFQRQITHFPVYTVEIDLPKYRLANGRTQAAQEEHLAKHPELGDDFFTSDLESDQAQRVQHSILLQMVRNTKLMDYFQDLTHGQEEPLILSYNGFVVNGNRRLCALRELYYKDQDTYSRYAHVDVLVLPYCTDKDLDELEAYLQIRPDIKENYTWIARACMLRARQDRYGYNYEQLSSLYGMTEKQIQAIFAQLALVDEYLMSIGKEKQYDSVENDEFAFKQLQKGRQLLKQADERDFFTQVSYCLVENSSAAGARLYQRIPEVRENLQEIAERLGQELKVDNTPGEPKLDYGLFGTEDAVDSLEPLTQTISKRENQEAVVEAVIDVIEGVKERERQHTKANAVLNQIAEANAHLKSAVIYINEDKSKQGIAEQLRSIEESIKAIREWLADNA
jgi:hypothetical protein